MSNTGSTSPSLLTVSNPYDHSLVAEIPYDSLQQMEAKLQSATAALAKWRLLSLDDRIRIVSAGLANMRADAEQIARNVTLQMGKPLAQARGELQTMFSRAEQSIADAPTALAADILPKAGFVRRIEHEPLGIVFDIAAWNYPLVIPINIIVPALLAGNVVLLKHSAKTPFTGQAFADAFAKLEIPDLVTNLTLTHAQTTELISNPHIDHVSFTGSVDGGHRIYQAVAQSRLIDVGLELGGKDPAYVAADADLDFAAANLVDGACYNAGQSCCAIERVYVHQTLYQPFLEKAAALLAEYQLGDPLDESTTMGPLASRSAPQFLQQQVDDAVGRGARLIVGGRAPSELAGNFYLPTLLADVANDAQVMQEESFGPLLPVSSVCDEDEAVARMNDSAFGLTASVWTSDQQRAEAIASRLNAGTIFQNRCDFLDPALPWTGWGDSGKGSTLSPYGFYYLTRRKSIHFRTAT
ncbi:MAG: aldehyde dehydrogenase family protein [Planctomycetales bacterium]|nr:aldehyde dehydrogenase family protein [Planctomycetales bacterium]